MVMGGKIKKHEAARGLLFVVAAPSGAGKTTLCRSLMQRLEQEGVPGLDWSVSYTTRQQRQGEEHGRDYFFVDDETFDRMVEGGEFAEWAKVHERRYGTSKKYLEQKHHQGVDLLLEIDTQGASQLREEYKQACFIFILPPSWQVLEQRLKGRATEKEVQVKTRLDRAKQEILEWRWFDYIIVNDDFDVAVDRLRAVVVAERHRTRVMAPRVGPIIGSAR